ncbi:MAG: TonB-dependent receptor [Vicinamibacterales bacterium]
MAYVVTRVSGRAPGSCVGALLVMTAVVAFAQGGANLGGAVRDNTGGALPGATVTITNRNTGAAQTLVTGPEGNFRAVNLPPAPYEISVELSGFGAQRKGVTLLVGADATIEFTLSVATLEESVNVVGEAPLVEVTKATPSTVVNGEQLASLPVLDRNFLVVAQIMPGAAPMNNLAVSSRFAVTKFGGVADQRNGFTTIIDGGSVDDATWGSPVINMSQDAVQEFKVFRNQFDAQYGSALNAVVNVVSKSGTNSFSGSGYYFGRDKALNARNAFATTVPPFRQARGGGSFGGPIAKNRTHVFAAVEYLNIDKAATIALSPSNPFASTQNGNYPYTITDTLGDVKVDHRFNDKHSMWARYAYDNQFTPTWGPVNAQGTFLDYSKSHSVAAEENWIVSQNKVNALRLHVLHHNLYTLPANYDLAVTRPSYSFGQNTVDPQYFPRTNVSVFDTFYVTTPRHDIKIGGELTMASSNFEAHFTEHGQFIFTTDAPFDANNSATWPQSFVMQTPGFYNYKSKQIAAYVQDDWRLWDNIRLNLGLRYDVDTNLRNNDFYVGLLDKPLYKGLDYFISRDRGNQYDNIQPRLGVTWDTKGDGHLVVRGGFGKYVTRNRPWFNETSMDKTLGSAVRITDPNVLRFYPNISAVLNGLSLDDYVARGGVRSLYLIGNDYRLPYALNSTIGFGWRLNTSTSLDVDYVHDVAGDQLGTTDKNLPATGAISAANPRPVPTFSQVGVLVNNGKAWYDALELQLHTRVRGTDSLQVSYTYSKSIIDAVTFYSTYSGTDRTPNNYAYNPTDTPHNLSIAASTSLPFEFQLSGVFRAISGGPVTVSAGVDLDGDLNTANDRPAGLPQTVGRGDVESQLNLINAFRASRGLAAIGAERLKLSPVVDLDIRLTKAVRMGGRRRAEIFLEGYNVLNHVTKYGGVGSMVSNAVLIRTTALDARQLQWGARFVF